MSALKFLLITVAIIWINIVAYSANAQSSTGHIFIVISTNRCPMPAPLSGRRVATFNGIESYPRPLVMFHDLQSEDSSRTQYRNRLLFMFSALTLLGMTCAAVGVYCICYCRDGVLALGLLLEIFGGSALIIGIGSIFGIATVYG